MRERACEAGPVAGRVLTSCPAFTGVNKLFGVYWLGFAKKFKTVSFISATWGIQGVSPCCLLGTLRQGKVPRLPGRVPANIEKFLRNCGDCSLQISNKFVQD